MKLNISHSLSIFNKKTTNTTTYYDTGETIYHEKYRRFCETKIGGGFPPISFHFITSGAEINHEKYSYRSHGGWFMLLGALLPFIIPNCPFDWKIGLAAGTGLALLWNALTFALFNKKINSKMQNPDTINAQHSAPVTELTEQDISTWQNFYILESDAGYGITTKDDKDYLYAGKDRETIQNIVQKHPDVFQNPTIHEKTKNMMLAIIDGRSFDGIAFAHGDTGRYVDKESALARRNNLDVLSEALLAGKSGFVFESIKNPDHYAMTEQRLVLFFDYEEACRHCRTEQLTEKFHVRQTTINDLKELASLAGFVLMDGYGQKLFDINQQDAARVLSRFASDTKTNPTAKTTHNDFNTPAQPKTHDTTDWNSDFATHIQRYVDEGDITKNTIFAKNTFLSFDEKKTMRNSNVLLLGGTEEGDYNIYSNFIIPNMLTQSCNFVTIDSDGALTESVHDKLKEMGYEVMVLNLKDMALSDKYNPFDYLETDASVQSLSEVFIQNTGTDALKNANDPFWEKSEIILLQACIFYLLNTQPKNKHNFASVYEFLDENNPEMLREIFANAISNAPSDDVAKCFKTVSEISPKALMSILIGLKVRLVMFVMPACQNITNEDTIDLYSMQEGKKALFIIAPPDNNVFDVIATMLLSQLMHITLAFGRNKSQHLRFFINVTPSTGYISDLRKTIPMSHASNASVVLAVSTIGQLQSMYPDVWDSTSTSMDSLLYLGSDDKSTIDYTATLISSSQTLDKSLTDITADLTALKEDECIVMIRGIKPFKDKKF